MNPVPFQHLPDDSEDLGVIIHDQDCFHSAALCPKQPLLGPWALAGRPHWRRRRRRIGATIDADGYEVRGRVGRHGRHGRIAGRREPESRPEIGGRELLNFDELGYGHREGHGKHEEAESRHSVRSTVSRLKIR